MLIHTSKIITRHQGMYPLLAHLSIVAVVLILAACEAAMPVALQEPIEGRGTDAETGAPLDSVDVLMTSGRIFINEEGHASVTTNADGLYEISHRFEDECPGDLRLGAFSGLSEYQYESVDLECTAEPVR